MSAAPAATPVCLLQPVAADQPCHSTAAGSRRAHAALPWGCGGANTEPPCSAARAGAVCHTTDRRLQLAQIIWLQRRRRGPTPCWLQLQRRLAHIARLKRRRGGPITQRRQLLLVLRVVHRQAAHARRQRRRVHAIVGVRAPPELWVRSNIQMPCVSAVEVTTFNPNWSLLTLPVI